jgi:hypothetical protein
MQSAYKRGMPGTLPSQEIEKLIADACVTSSAQIKPEQVQPSSLDACVRRH